MNLLAHHALFAAALAKAKTLTTEHVQSALQEVAGSSPRNPIEAGAHRLVPGLSLSVIISPRRT
ncbi:MAG: hypothetical protein IT379_39750 [Deltaproteobacteria bacterium]|nr:hypothetical protein [Deltaproteobacteria bacterium]